MEDYRTERGSWRWVLERQEGMGFRCKWRFVLNKGRGGEDELRHMASL